MRIKLILFFVLVIGFINLAHAEPIKFDDLYSFPQISNPKFSPSGNKIVFELRNYDLDSNYYSQNIWLISPNDGRQEQITFDKFIDSNPQWLNDSTIILESDRSDDNQLWWMSSSGGEMRQLTSKFMEASGAVLSPTSEQILLASENYFDCLTDSCNQSRYEAEESNPIKAKLYDKLMFRHYKYWANDKLSQLFKYDIPSDSIYQLTFEKTDVPTSTLGGNGDYVFSPDGKEVCFVMNRDSILTLSTNNDLFLIPSSGWAPIKITENKGQDNTPRYSPDGKYIAYLAQARAGYESDQNELMLYDRKSGSAKKLTDQFDCSVGYYIWGPDSKYIYFKSIEYGLNKIWQIDIETLQVKPLLDDINYSDFDLSPDGKYIAAVGSSPIRPNELFLYDIDAGTKKRLTPFADELTSRVKMNLPEDFWFEGFNGDSVQGFITLPYNFDPSKKYPLAFLIHGGPQWCWLKDFNYYGWNTQLVAAQGYIVVQINPHGSLGYGIKFKEYVSGNWGKGDYEDLILGLDYVLANYPQIDSTRMAALGRSYGGFMINWINGHTDRFKCLICIDGTFDQISEYGATDELWFPEWEAKGTPWTNREEYVRSSPITYSVNMKTPTMFIHGQLDYRVDISEAFQAFTTLQRMGVPSQLLYFPDEGHSISELYNHRYVYQKQFEWLARWLK